MYNDRDETRTANNGNTVPENVFKKVSCDA